MYNRPNYHKNFRALAPVVLEIHMESPKTLNAYSRYSLSLGRKQAQFVTLKLSPLIAPQFRGISYLRKCRPVDLN